MTNNKEPFYYTGTWQRAVDYLIGSVVLFVVNLIMLQLSGILIMGIFDFSGDISPLVAYILIVTLLTIEIIYFFWKRRLYIAYGALLQLLLWFLWVMSIFIASMV